MAPSFHTSKCFRCFSCLCCCYRHQSSGSIASSPEISFLDDDYETEEEDDILDELSWCSKDRIYHALTHFIVNKVRGLNEETLPRYLEFIQTTFPLDNPHWEKFEQEARTCISAGPRLKISSMVINTDHDKLKRKHLRADVYFTQTPTIRIRTEFQENDVFMIFDQPGYLHTPGFSDPVLRIDVLKASKKGNNSEKVVMSADIKLSEIVFNQPVYVQLEERNLSVLNSSIHSSDPSRSHILITGCLEDDHDHPNQTIPHILNQILVETANQIVDLELIQRRGRPSDSFFPDYFSVEVSREDKSNSPGSWRYFKQDFQEKRIASRSEHAAVDCILTDRIEFRTSETVTSSSHLPTTSRYRKLTKSEGSTSLPVLEISQFKPKTVALDSCRWNVELQPHSTKMFDVDELGRIYREILTKETSSTWDGTMSNSTSTILSILEQFTRPKPAKSYISLRRLSLAAPSPEPLTVPQTIALAYLDAYNKHGFSQKFLRDHVEVLSHSKHYTRKTVKTFISASLERIRNLRSYTREELKYVVEHLSVLAPLEDIRAEVARALDVQAQEVFQLWWRELRDSESVPSLQENTSSQDELAVISRLLNEYVFPNLEKGSEEYVGVFTPVALSFRDIVGEEFINLATKLIIKHIWSRVQLSDFLSNRIHTLDIVDEENEYFQQAYNCYSSLRRLCTVVDSTSNLPAHVFRDHSEAWLSIGIHKAKIHLKRMVYQQTRTRPETDPKKMPGTNWKSAENLKEDDHDDQLAVFLDISESCWKLWEDLTYPDQDKELECCILLIDGLKSLENLFVDEREKIFHGYKILDVEETVKFVRLLDSLKERYKIAGEKLNILQEKLDKGKMDENISHKIGEAFPKLNEMKRLLDDEIEGRMLSYASGHHDRIQGCIEESRVNRLISEESVLGFLDTEMSKIHKHFINNTPEDKLDICRQYSRKLSLLLWNQFEKQLTDHFERKKKRNVEKNKPARFDFLKAGMEDIVQCKTIAVQNEIIEETSLDKLSLMREELKILTMTTGDLISNILRMKEEAEDNEMKEDVEAILTGARGGSGGPTINFNLGYIRDVEKVALEIRSITNLRKLDRDKINIEFRSTFFPPRQGEVINVSEKKMYTVNKSSWVFDTSENEKTLDRLVFIYTVDEADLSVCEDCYVCIDLFDKPHQLKPATFLAEAVFQVCKYGTVLPDIPEFRSLDEFYSHSYSSQKKMSKEFIRMSKSPSFNQIRERKDDLAKSFVKWQKRD